MDHPPGLGGMPGGYGLGFGWLRIAMLRESDIAGIPHENT